MIEATTNCCHRGKNSLHERVALLVGVGDCRRRRFDEGVKSGKQPFVRSAAFCNGLEGDLGGGAASACSQPIQVT